MSDIKKRFYRVASLAAAMVAVTLLGIGGAIVWIALHSDADDPVAYAGTRLEAVYFYLGNWELLWLGVFLFSLIGGLLLSLRDVIQHRKTPAEPQASVQPKANIELAKNTSND